MAISTFKSFLMHKVAEKWEKLIDIVSYPDQGSSPELLDATSLSDPATVNIPGIASQDALEYECNYDLEKYAEINGMGDTDKEFALWLGGTEANGVVTPTGSDGKFKCKGRISAYLNGGGVNEVRKMTVVIVPSSKIVLDETA
jgi:hypothetical protein